MAFVLKRDVQFPLAFTDAGPVAVVEVEFSFVFVSGIWSDSIAELEFYLNVGLFAADILPEITTNYLGYTIEADTDPFIDRYRITIKLAGEIEESSGSLGPFRPFAVVPQVVIPLPGVLILVAAIGLAGLLGVIAYRTFTLGLGPALGIPPWAMGVGAIAIGLVLVQGLIRRPEHAR